ncbi:MAG TPA: amidohydrolase family protein [Candidatus Binatia bacterium]|nr:amidohydrolase family protein [Candidatus Binatia bacterium]
MPYAEGRVYHDADSHVMETPDWLVPHAEPAVRARLRPLVLTGCKPGEESFIDELRRRREDPAERAAAAREIMLRKNWSALGAFVREDRPRALDALGFASQLVFNTFLNPLLLEAEHGADLDWAYGFARAHNRALLHFCAVDRRLLPTAYVPLADFDRARAMAEEAIAAGAKALLVASACPARHSPSHTGLFPVWAAAEEAGVPIVLHVGGGGRLLDPHFFANGLPPVPDFHGGTENFRSVDYMAIPGPPMQMLATLIIDGVLAQAVRRRHAGPLRARARPLLRRELRRPDGRRARRLRRRQLSRTTVSPSPVVLGMPVTAWRFFTHVMSSCFEPGVMLG